MRTLYLCGAGNGEGIRLALQVNRASERWARIVLLDDDASKHGSERLGVTVAGAFDRLREADASLDEVVNLVTRTTTGRARARERIASFGIPFASLVHPGVDLLGARLADEVTIYEHTTIGAEASVGPGSVVLVGAVVGHGSQVGRGCVVAPNAVINARVVHEDGVYVGSNASVLPDLRLGAGATIAANTLVLSDVPAGATALGVPAEVIAPAHDEANLDEATRDAAPGPMGHGGLARTGATDQASAANESVGEGAETPAGPGVGRAGAGAMSTEGMSAGMPAPAALEPEIARVMGEVLSLPEVPRTANFFDLGGTSLKAIQLCQTIGQRCGVNAQALDVFRFPTVAALAAHYAGSGGPSALSLAQQRAAMRRRR